MSAALKLAGACVVVVIGASTAFAQSKWPTKPIRMIVPFTSSSACDVLGRIVCARLTEIHGQQFVIDNRPGAGGLIGSELTRSAAPDGYTLEMIGQPHISNVLLRDAKSRPYDPLKDFAPISLIAITPNVIVIGKGIEAKTIPDLIALAKAKPGSLNYGSAGVGSSSHLAGALFVSKAGIDVVHVPFRQGADSRTALINGTLQFYIYPLPAIVGMIRAGQLRALAVTTAKRAEALPDVPTSAEAGFPQYRSESWFGMIGPRGLSKSLVSTLDSDIVTILNEPETRRKIVQQGAIPSSSTPDQFEKMQRDEYRELGALIRESGMHAR
jgi:tripartite-type tricarboxylate transporter receptor subunit TctC